MQLSTFETITIIIITIIMTMLDICDKADNFRNAISPSRFDCNFPGGQCIRAYASYDIVNRSRLPIWPTANGDDAYSMDCYSDCAESECN